MKFFLSLIIIAIAATSLHAQTCNQFVGGYVPAYRDASSIDFTKVSHAFYAFAVTNASGDVLPQNATAFNTFKTATVGKQRYLSLGGAGDATLPAMATSASARQAFAGNCVTFCKAHALQGVDMDWEGIRSVEDSTNFGALMRDLAIALHAEGLQLVATIGYGSWSGDYYNVGALKAADWIQLMVYDQTGTWADSPFGNHASFQHVLDAIQYWHNRGYTDKSKIVIGLPFYGYQFHSNQGGLASAKTYAEIVAANNFLRCNQDETGLTVFNSPETIRKKVRYVIEEGFKGVMIWELGQDVDPSQEKSLLQAVSLAACDEPAACDASVTGIAPNGELAFALSPNPAHNLITVSVRQGIKSLTLMGSTGSIVFHQQYLHPVETETIDVSMFAPGVYFFKILTGGRLLMVKKVLVKSLSE